MFASPVSQIESILNNDYGVGIACAEPCVVLWALAKCDDPKKQLAIANKIRRRHGRYLVSVPWGDPLFDLVR